MKMKMDFQKTVRIISTVIFRNIFLFSVQLQVFYIQSSIFFSFMNEMDNMVLPYRVQIRLLGYLQYLIGTSGKIVWKRFEPN